MTQPCNDSPSSGEIATGNRTWTVSSDRATAVPCLIRRSITSRTRRGPASLWALIGVSQAYVHPLVGLHRLRVVDGDVLRSPRDEHKLATGSVRCVSDVFHGESRRSERAVDLLAIAEAQRRVGGERSAVCGKDK